MTTESPTTPVFPIPLLVDVPEGLGGRVVPLRFGVPIPRGVLPIEPVVASDPEFPIPDPKAFTPPVPDPKQLPRSFGGPCPGAVSIPVPPLDAFAVRMTDAGGSRLLPTRIEALAPWSDDDVDGVRWLAVDTVVDVDRHHASTQYELVRGNAPSIGSPVRMDELEGGVLLVETGAATFSVHTRGEVGIDGIAVGLPGSREMLVPAGSPIGITLEREGPDAGSYRAFGDEDSWSVETCNGLRLGLRLIGCKLRFQLRL